MGLPALKAMLFQLALETSNISWWIQRGHLLYRCYRRESHLIHNAFMLLQTVHDVVQSDPLDENCFDQNDYEQVRKGAREHFVWVRYSKMCI